MYSTPNGLIFRHRISGITAKVLIIGANDSIDNYEMIPEPEEPQEDDDNGESDISV